MDNKGLLKSDEIQQILDIVNAFPHLSLPNVILSDHEGKTGLVLITPNVGIIIFKGNIETGFKHIIARHNFSSMKTFFVPENGRMKIDNPSKFSRKFIPIIDLRILTEQLYTLEYLNTVQNKNPDLFDLFIGDAEDSHGDIQNYKMLLYKGTKILHTIYPTKRENNHTKNRYKIISLSKGKTKAEVTFNPIVTIMGFPYRDINGVPKYSFEELINYNLQIGIQRIRDITSEKVIAQAEIKVTSSFDLNQFEINAMFFHKNDSSAVEKIIKKYHNETYPDKI